MRQPASRSLTDESAQTLKQCSWHLCSKPCAPGPRRGGGAKALFCSKGCAQKGQRRRKKERAVALLGGGCSSCGAVPCRLEHLVFHHVGVKNFSIGPALGAMGWQRLLRELEHCVLMCVGCHAAAHNYVRPLRFNYVVQEGQQAR